MKKQFDRILFETTNELIGYLIKMGANPEDAKDVSQETLLKILEIETELSMDKIRPWMYRVGINLYFNLYNQTKRRAQILEQYFHVIPEEWQEYDHNLFEALNQLDVKSAHLLVLKYSEERSMKEIAFLLNRPEESINTELYRARKKLKQLLDRLSVDD